MRACFCTKPKAIEFEQELQVLPRVGEYVCVYRGDRPLDAKPEVYRVLFIVHAYDQRDHGPTFDPSEPHAYIRVKKTKDPFKKKRRAPTDES